MRMTLVIGMKSISGQFSYGNRLAIVSDNGSYIAELDIPIGEVDKKDFADFAQRLKQVATQVYHNPDLS